MEHSEPGYSSQPLADFLAEIDERDKKISLRNAAPCFGMLGACHFAVGFCVYANAGLSIRDSAVPLTAGIILSVWLRAGVSYLVQRLLGEKPDKNFREELRNKVVSYFDIGVYVFSAGALAVGQVAGEGLESLLQY